MVKEVEYSLRCQHEGWDGRKCVWCPVRGRNEAMWDRAGKIEIPGSQNTNVADDGRDGKLVSMSSYRICEESPLVEDDGT
jgi:hypothetical protein